MKKLKLAFTLFVTLFAVGLSFAQDWSNTARFKDDNAKV